MEGDVISADLRHIAALAKRGNRLRIDRHGRVVGIESELIKPLDGLPAGVISYTMWDAESR